MQWTDCEMLWRRASGWQERQGFQWQPSQHTLCWGQRPTVCWCVLWEPVAGQVGQNKETQLYRLVSVWSKQAPWVEDRSRLLPVGSAVFLEGNRQRHRGSVKTVSGLFMFGWLFLLHPWGPISDSPLPYNSFPNVCTTVLAISVSSFFFSFLNENNAMSITKHKC